MSDDGKWWGPYEIDPTAPRVRPGRIVNRKARVLQKDGTWMMIETGYGLEEYEKRLREPPRSPKKIPDPPWERKTKVPETVQLWDELRRDPFAPLTVVKCPPGYTPSSGEPWSDHPYDFYSAADVRRLRIPASWREDWNPDEHCISAIFGCTDPLTRKTPERCCDRCYWFHHRRDRWPNRSDIQKRPARDARASKKSQGIQDEHS
jgi:hypothetical protein